jgi:hypothetical protein
LLLIVNVVRGMAEAQDQTRGGARATQAQQCKRRAVLAPLLAYRLLRCKRQQRVAA